MPPPPSPLREELTSRCQYFASSVCELFLLSSKIDMFCCIVPTLILLSWSNWYHKSHYQIYLHWRNVYFWYNVKSVHRPISEDAKVWRRHQFFILSSRENRFTLMGSKNWHSVKKITSCQKSWCTSSQLSNLSFLSVASPASEGKRGFNVYLIEAAFLSFWLWVLGTF